jgi:hypothetical protein
VSRLIQFLLWQEVIIAAPVNRTAKLIEGNGPECDHGSGTTKSIKPLTAAATQVRSIDRYPVEFIDENGGGPGVRSRKRHQKKR